MSDRAGGPGWWRAADGRWYPPPPFPPPPVYPPPEFLVFDPRYAAPAPKKPFYKAAWFWIGVIVVVIAGSCSAVVGVVAVVVQNAENKQHVVVYSVSGSGAVSVVVDSTGTGHSEQTRLADVALPWSKRITVEGFLNNFGVTATLGPAGGQVSCAVSIDGRQVSAESASGPSGQITCTGTVGPFFGPTSS